MRNVFFILLCTFLVAACSDNQEIVKFPTVENKYDPSLPILADKIKPDYGGIDETFVIEGNFKGDISEMKVYFGNKRAILVATDGRSIVGVVPKQAAGYNAVSVVIGQDSIAPDDLKFKYKQTKSVKTIAGAFGVDEYVVGDINAARFNEPTCIATVKGQNGDNIIVVESWWINRLSLISLDDNKVVQLGSGASVAGGKPAVDNTREKFYTIGHWGDQHYISSFSRVDGWTQTMTGIQITPADCPSNIFSIQCADDDNFLYTLGASAEFFRVDLQASSYKRITLRGDRLPSSFVDRSQLAWSKYHRCFFACFPNENGIYKFSKEYEEGGGTLYCDVTRYAGFNGSGSKGGHRLNDAQFISPNGLTVTSEGEIYVINREGAFINKISGDHVELVAGLPGTTGTINGDPLAARFNWAQDIVVDADDNFFIAGGGDKTVRKLSIE
jgi:hypothetical protein